MRQGWQVNLEGYGLRFKNEVPYTIYNEMGTRFMKASPMARPTIPETQTVFKQELGRSIGRKLAANIIGGLGSGIPQISSPRDGAVFDALTRARNPAPKGRGFRGSYKTGFNFTYEGIKKLERQFGKAIPARTGQLDSEKARSVGAI
jgi:hypothetical protein